MPLALPALFALAGIIFAIGLLTMSDAFTRALFGGVAKGLALLPWVGKSAANGVLVIGKRISNVLGAAILHLQGTVSYSWHVLANLIEQTGAAIWDATSLAAHVAWLVEVKYPLDVLSALAHKAAGATTAVTKVTTTTVKRVTVVQGVTRAQLVRLGKRLAVLEARVVAFPVLGAGAIALPFPRIGALERTAHATRARVGKLERRFGRKAFAASVATALGVLGLSWTRRTCTKRNNDLLCKTDFGALEALLAGAVLAVGTQSVVRFAEGMLAAEGEMVGVLERMVVELGDVAG